MIAQILILFIPLSLLALLICLLIPKQNEKAISSIALSGVFINFLLFLVLLYSWVIGGFRPLFQEGITLYSGQEYTFALDFFFDLTSAVFFGMTCITTMLIFMFSKFYMHRDHGFKRFYSTILAFFTGLTLIIFAGNFETLFVGWEIIGISSFLLVAFYRDRFLPAKNALKVFTQYRIADAFLLIALWYAHHLFEKNIRFSEIGSLVAEHGNALAILGGLLLVVALIKSAQFPFSYWLPRAMEGPTTSSAIFYGALSVHMGLFLLLRTAPFWQGSMLIIILLGVFGLATALISSSIARVQSSIKTQIAYSSITQIGIMFIEVALGLHGLALFHFVGNAFLRTYQLLISPSIVGYLIHNQFFQFILPPQKIQNSFFGKLRASLYITSIKEWDMDIFFSQYIWRPFKAIGRAMKFTESTAGQIGLIATFILIVSAFAYTHFSTSSLSSIATVSGVMSVLMYVRAFSSKGNTRVTWNHIFFGHLFGLLFIGFYAQFQLHTILLYIAGVGIAFFLGHIILAQLERKNERDDLLEFHGHMYEYSTLGNIFFFVCLAFMAFPITPSFLGQEIMLGYLQRDHVLQIIIFAFGYVLSGVSIIRIFAKVFFGPHHKTYHEIAYKSS